MENKKTGLREQEAPEKNTDRAFVKVSKDGSPEIPGKDKKDQKREKPAKPAK